MKLPILLSLLIVLMSQAVSAKPKILVKHQRNQYNLAQVQITNQTSKKLRCFVAIDGYKIKFKLPPRLPSKWYQATDPRFNHKSFSVQCDYLNRAL